MTTNTLPIAVIGAGPVGLAAAAHLVERGLPFIVLERKGPGAALRQWGQIELFSPWRHNIDAAARSLLTATGWRAPDPEGLPTGDAMVQDYLAPLAAHPAIAPNLVTGASVTAISRAGHDKMTSRARDTAAFTIAWTDSAGDEHRTLARAVIDATGTFSQPNPMGADGLPVPGERGLADAVTHGLPDVAGEARDHYAGKTTLVVGSGHSALNTILSLLKLKQDDPSTRVIWAMRANRLQRLLGGGLNDQLPARGALGLAAQKALEAGAMEAGAMEVLTGFAATRLSRAGARIAVAGTLDGDETAFEVDRIVVATGFRPDLQMLQELRVAIDPATEAPPALSPLIDPNVHSCGTVPPHGMVELTHPEPGFYIAGSKSYGRAPTFLMATGYEQVRSIAAELAGDHAAARDVQLVLPETGVCGVPGSVDIGGSAGCCGGPAQSADACCVADETAKAAGEAGCGCGSKTAQPGRTSELA
ncbi:NAD(P)-binding domain-containing protein [Devosia sp.]|uniref:NAD(P)-binding domain-containing protein n=1 Tax=Devosia sp. TaxID=1871048 RepID=UPI003A957F5C